MADVILACCNISELLRDNQADWHPDFMKPPDMETKLLIPALAEHGVDATWAIWDDAGVELDAHRLCVTRSTWTHFLHPDAFLNWTDEVSRSSTLVNPTTLVRWNMHKGYLLALDAHGVRTIPTEVVTAGDAPATCEIAAQWDWPEIIVKPAISAGATGIGRFRTDDGNAQVHLECLLTTGDVVIQPFAPDIQESGEISLVFIDGEFSHAVRKHPLPGDYRAQPHLGASLIPCGPSDEELAVASSVLDALPDRALYARVDLIEYEGAPTVNEVELVDPYLFLDRVPEGLERFTVAVVKFLDRLPTSRR